MKIDFVEKVDPYVSKEKLEKALLFFSEKLNLKEKTLVLAFMSSEEIQALNLKYRGKDKPTDVLSFQSTENESVGELALCPHMICSQSKNHGLSHEEEFFYVALHGLLHLLGYDHETSEADKEAMFSLQEKLFDDFLSQSKKS